MPLQPRLLLVDDDPSMCELLHVRLAKRGFDAPWQTSATRALKQLGAEAFDVVITDMRMAEMGGLELCDRIVSNHPETHVVLMTAHACVDAAVAALRARAHDFLVKPFEIDALVTTIESAWHLRRARRALAVPSQDGSVAAREWGEIVGLSTPMVELRELVARVATVDTSVAITGESGTGKELIARAIHRLSMRARGPFISVNCAAIPETLIEAELFGHTRGAYTDARSERRGLFLDADKGTLLLDEIAELPLHIQAKLLRALQERAIRPLGSSIERPFDVRIVSATNRNLAEMVRQGHFREDLYYRLNVVEVCVPPLRNRGDDILRCARHFVARFSSAFGKNVQDLSTEAATRLLAHSWPGNVRELQNVMERGVALTRSDHIAVEDLPEPLQRYCRIPRFEFGREMEALASLEDMERRHIAAVMRATGGNRTAAAEILGVDRRTLLRKTGPVREKVKDNATRTRGSPGAVDGIEKRRRARP